MTQNSGQQSRFYKLVQVFFLRLPDKSETCLPTCTDMGNEAYYSNDREMESHQHIDHSDYLHLLTYIILSPHQLWERPVCKIHEDRWIHSYINAQRTWSFPTLNSSMDKLTEY